MMIVGLFCYWKSFFAWSNLMWCLKFCNYKILHNTWPLVASMFKKNHVGACMECVTLEQTFIHFTWRLKLLNDVYVQESKIVKLDVKGETKTWNPEYVTLEHENATMENACVFSIFDCPFCTSKVVSLRRAWKGCPY